VNIQGVRVWAKERLAELDTADLWEITLATWPELSATHTVNIGHAAPSPDTFKRRRVELPVTWWVNEANEDASVADLYAALSFAPGSLVADLLALPQIRSVAVNDVGAEVFGPAGFLRAEMLVTVVFDEGDEESS
jgi:hypothetical protein